MIFQRLAERGGASTRRFFSRKILRALKNYILGSKTYEDLQISCERNAL